MVVNSNFVHVCSYRTEEQQLKIVRHIPAMSSLGKKWSTHPVASGLYGLPGVVDIHEKVKSNIC